METHSDLTIIDSSQRPRVLTSDSDRVLTLLRMSRVVDDERLDAGQLAVELARQSREHLAVGPRADGDALLQALAHRLNLAAVVDQPGRHRLDALSLAVEQKPGDVPTHRAPPLGPPHVGDHRVDILAQVAI